MRRVLEGVRPAVQKPHFGAYRSPPSLSWGRQPKRSFLAHFPPISSLAPAMISGGSAKARLSAAVISSPWTGSTCRLFFSTSARNAGIRDRRVERVAQFLHALGAVRRAAAITGRSSALRHHQQLELLAGRLVMHEFHHRRRVGEFRAALLGDDDRHRDLVLGQPIRPRRFDHRKLAAAAAVELAALHREVNIGAVLVAARSP